MRFASLGSGSAGNSLIVEATSIGTEPTRLLLDCGFSTRDAIARLQRLDCQPEQITGILVTHEHEIGRAHV